MKLFFLASIVASDPLKEDFKSIINTFESQGHVVIYKHVFENLMDLEKSTVNALERRAKKLINEMYSCEAVIFEGTHSSTGAGYFLSAALQKSIPVLFAHQEKNYSGLYLADPNRLLIIKQYHIINKIGFEKIAKRFIKFAEKKRLGNRFNLMISDSMNEYLNKKAKETHLSKADFIRNLVYSKIAEDEKV